MSASLPSAANVTTSAMPQLPSDISHRPSPQPMPPPSSTIPSTDAPRSSPPSNPVHLLWDLESVPFPTNATSADVHQRLAAMTTQYGLLRTFDAAYHHRAINAAAAARIDSAIETLRSFGAAVDRIQYSVEVWIVTSILQLTLNVQMTSLTGATRPVIILISSNAAVATALSAASQSQLFAEVVLCHSSNTDQSLLQSCTLAINFDVMNQINKSTSLFDTLERREGEEEPRYRTTELDYISGINGESETSMRAPFSHFTTEDDDDITALTHSIDHLRSLSSSPVPSSTSFGGVSMTNVPYSTFDTSRAAAHSYNAWEPSPSPPPVHAGHMQHQQQSHVHQRTNDYSPAEFGHYSGEADYTAYNQGGRSSMRYPPATASTNSSKGRKGPNSMTQGSMSIGTSHAHPQTLSAGRARTCIQAFHKVIAYCEQEKIIPRESVVKKRLLDSKIGIELDFEELVLAVREYGAGVIEGEPPQRIIWPRGPNNEARKFPCVDFLTPRSRLSSDQMNELFKFLLHFQPEVDRGRFGFAQYLGRHGPLAIRTLPHGILVELVQLLLNQKVLLFRKGRVSVSPALLTDPSLLQLALSGQPTAAATAAAGVNVTTPIQSANASPMPSPPPPEKDYVFASQWPGSAPSTPPGHSVRSIRPTASWLNSGPSTTSAAQLQRAQQQFLTSTSSFQQSPPVSPPPAPQPSQPVRRFGGLDPNQPAFVSMFESPQPPAESNESELHTDGGESDRNNALPPLHNRVGVVAEWKQFIGRPRGSSLPPRPDPLNFVNGNGHYSTPSSPVPVPQSGVDSPVPVKYNVYRRNSTGGTTDGYSGPIHSTTSGNSTQTVSMGSPVRVSPGIRTSSSGSKLNSFADTFMNAKTERLQLNKIDNTSSVNELHDRLVMGTQAAPLYHWEVATSDDGKSYFLAICSIRLMKGDHQIVKRFQSPPNMNRLAAQNQAARSALESLESVFQRQTGYESTEVDAHINITSLQDDQHNVPIDAVLDLDRLLYRLNQPQMIYVFATEADEKRTVTCSARLIFNQQSGVTDERIVSLQLPTSVTNAEFPSKVHEFSSADANRYQAKLSVAGQIISALHQSQPTAIFVSPPVKHRTIDEDNREGAKLSQSLSTQSTPVVTSDKLISRSLPTAISSCIPTDRTSSPDSASIRLGPALLNSIHPASDDVNDGRLSNMSILSAMKTPVTPNSSAAASLFSFTFQQTMIKPPPISEATNADGDTDVISASSDTPNRVIGRPRSYSID